MRNARVAFGVVLSFISVAALCVAFWYISDLVDRSLALPLAPVGYPFNYILAGLAWSVGLFWVLWAHSYLVFVGFGSPVEAFGVALEPTSNLVTAGPYAYVRNPMVFGLLFILWGIAFLSGSISGVFLVVVVALVIAGYLKTFEEKALERRFGANYEHYREHVPLMIPRPVPYVPSADEA